MCPPAGITRDLTPPLEQINPQACEALPLSCPSLVQALEIFESMARQGLPRDAITYSATISSLAKGKQWHAALQMFDHMQVRRHEFTALVSGCARRTASVLEQAVPARL